MPVLRPMSPALELEELKKAFGGLLAVAGVSLRVERGERLVLIGPNGAGKTTLFNLITGDHRPTAGRVRMFGHDVTRWPPYRRAAHGLARTFQITSLFPRLTVAENVLIAVQGLRRSKYRPFGSPWASDAIRARVDQVLRTAGLGDLAGHVVASLSYGDQRRLEVALALASRPRLLLLDEPMAGLSPADRPAVAALIRALPQEITVIVIEHDIDIAFQLAERVVVLHQGVLVAEGTPEQIRANATVQSIYLGGA